MKILVFCPYYPPHVGGLENHSEEFNHYLASPGVEITVYTPHLPASAPLEEHFPYLQIIRFPAFDLIPNFPLPKFWLPTFWKGLYTLFREDYTHVISRTRFFVSSFLALIFAKLKHLPLVHIEHGSDFVKLSSPWKNVIAKIYDYTFGQIVIHFSSVNISISKAVQRFVAIFDKRLSPVIYRGVDFNLLDSIPPNSSLRTTYSEKIILVTAARLYKWKGIEHSITAIRSLPKNIQSRIVFLIIGNGEDFDHLKSLSKDLPIVFLGNLKREEVIRTLKASHIYIHSSLPGGGLSTSLLEAMDANCAIIATPNEGADEVITQDNGLLVNTASPEDIREKIAMLVENIPLQEKLGQAAKRTVRERFNWERSKAQYLAILQSL